MNDSTSASKPDPSVYDFDKVWDRTGTNAAKTEPRVLKMLYERDDLLPLWVADMDFAVAPAIIDAITKRTEHPIFGYTTTGKEYQEAIQSWFERRHNWEIEVDWLAYAPGVVPAINFIIQQYTRPGDKIIIQPPVYYPFKSCIEENGRYLLQNQLKYENHTYSIDFDHFEGLCKQKRVKMFILCNPHNPVGRIWTKEELERLGNICLEHEILVIADEIHCDLEMPGFKYTPFASLSPEFAQNSITCTAPTKTFNLAGMHVSNMIIPNEKLRNEYVIRQTLLGIRAPTIFGAEALVAAYSQGEQWLDAVLHYIHQNYLYFKEELIRVFPKIKILPLEGTYLVWADFTAYNWTNEKLEKLIKDEAKLALNRGYMFGPGGDGFQRFNIATPRKILEEVIARLEKVMNENPEFTSQK